MKDVKSSEKASILLDIQGLSKTFFPGTVNQRQAIRDVSLQLAPGEVVTLIGGNGAGKSTLFALIAGSCQADRGGITLDGQEIIHQREHARAHAIGRLMQDPLAGTAPGMTVEENIALAYLRGVGRTWTFGLSKKEKAHAREQLSMLGLGLEDRMNARMGLLSGGERQAITLVMATIVPPKLLLLDEHTAALDPQTADKVLSITQQVIARERITTLIITHNIATALNIGTRTLMMDQGEIVLDLDEQIRKGMTVETLLTLFTEKRKRQFDEDRVLF